MLKAIGRSGIAAAMLWAVSGGVAHAATVEVTIPFSFEVHGRPLPAGQYRIDRENTDPEVVLIHGEHGNPIRLVVLTMPIAGPHPAVNQPSLIFVRHEGQYRLADIWETGGEGWEISK